MYVNIEEVYRLKKVIYYSVRIENESFTEIEKFINLYSEDVRYGNDLGYIMALLKIMGEEKGALSFLFRNEAQAFALPPNSLIARKNDFVHFLDSDLRLFCLRLDEKIVILFNGGVKKSQKTQDSPELFLKFRMAQKFSKAITQKIIDKELYITNGMLDGDFELFI